MVQERGEVKAAAEGRFRSKVQSYIYEFKFYFYRADFFFSPLKLCLEWQNCFCY